MHPNFHSNHSRANLIYHPLLAGALMLSVTASASAAPMPRLSFDPDDCDIANNIWHNEQGVTKYDWTLDAPNTGGSDGAEHDGTPTLVTVSDSQTPGITHAVDSPDATMPDFTQSDFPGGALSKKQPFSFEIWVKPENFDGDHVLFETGGGGAGMFFEIEQNQLIARARATKVVHDMEPALADQFNQIVYTIDTPEGDGTGGILYINGEEVGTEPLGNDGKWNGGNPAGLGTINAKFKDDNEGDSTNSNNLVTLFDGQIAHQNYYATVLTDTEVRDAYRSLTTIPEPASLSLLGLGLFMIVRDRHRSH